MNEALAIVYRPVPPSLSYLASLGTTMSRQAIDGALRVVVRELSAGQSTHQEYPWWLLDPIRLGVLRGSLIARYSPRTVNVMMAAIRGTLKAAWLERLLDRDGLERLLYPLKAVKVSPTQTGRMISMKEIKRLQNTILQTPSPIKRARDMAALALILEAGLRKGELCALELKNYKSGMIQVCKSKHYTYRSIPIVWADRCIREWLEFRGTWPGPLLTALKAPYGQEIYHRRMAPRTLFKLVRLLAKRSRMKAWSPHDGRRTFISLLLATGSDLVTTAALAGHRSVITTAGYDRRPQEARMRAVRRLNLG